MRNYFVVVCVAAANLSLASVAVSETPSVAEEIRVEATRPNTSDVGRPLPLACSWQCGSFRRPICAKWRPENQMLLIEQGRHLLPWFSHPPREGEVPNDPDDFLLQYYRAPILKARELRLPVTFVGSQWESGLSREPYFSLPPEKNPNVVTADGKILKQVSPFGPVEPWREIGVAQTDNPWMRKLQEWYPDPPLVIFLSNNEHPKLVWHKAETSRRYLEKYGKGKDDEFKRKVVAEGWIERYRTLQAGMRAGLKNEAWKKNAVFVGYGVGDLAHFGRWAGWMNYSLYIRGRLHPGALMWDGGSPSYYTHDWNPSRDDTVWSPQIEFMNNVLVQREIFKMNPRFWYEFSVWDGYHANAKRQKKYPSTRSVYRNAGQTYNPERYAGFVQFGMWLMRPRAVRDFRGWTEPWNDKLDENGRVVWEGGGPYFMALVGAVDRVYQSSTLKQWWRLGRLAPNRAHEHPYQTRIPQEYKSADRWYLLDADCNMQEYPWELHWPVNVFALALTQGQRPNRRWLVYAHAPHGQRSGVKLTIPDYKEITVDVAVGGSFYLVDEKLDSVTAVE